MMRQFWQHIMVTVASAFALTLLLAATATAQSYDTTPILSIELNKGQLVHLDAPATSVMIANPAIADIQIISPRAVFIHGRSIGETSFLALDSSDYPIFESTVEVTHNISKLQRTLKRLAPDADVNFKTVDSGMVIEGFTDNQKESEMIHSLAAGAVGANGQVLNMINTAGSDQVTLKVKIAEVSRSELERFGINLAEVLNRGNFAFQLLQGRALSPAGPTRNGTDGGLFFNWDGGNGGGATAMLDALETDGYVSILAEPNLTTTSGQTANFLAGGEVPIPVVDGDGGVSVAYREFGIRLEFTPTVMSDGKISMRVVPEVSTLSTINQLQVSNAITYNIPSLQVRRADTTVELGSGQSFAVAGLFSNDHNNSIDKFPGLGEVPVLGALFRSQQFRNNQTELVIIVTPYISKPVRAETELATPIDGYYPPTDLQRILLGSLNQEESITNAEVKALGELHGGGGFILE